MLAIYLFILFQLFEHCLAPNTVGDGTGCDNMTCIIVQFKKDGINGHLSNKRPASSLEETTDSKDNLDVSSAKRQKTEDVENTPASAVPTSSD